MTTRRTVPVDIDAGTVALVDLTAAEMLAEDAERAADEATIAAEATRFRAAG